MVMTIHKLTAGDGYTYLTRQVAGGDTSREPGQDAAGYYTATGNPPGRWIGKGAPLLGLAGHQVTEEQMRALFGHGQHPDSEATIRTELASRTRPGMAATELARARRDAIRAASLGRPFPVYALLDKFEVRVRRRLAIITEETRRAPTEAEIRKVQRDEARRQRAAVAGFDAVFAPVKSAVLLWALDERPWVRAAVRQAHGEAKNVALGLLEEHAAFTRTGTGGLAQIQSGGLIAAAFDHYDSRDGDPNLHTHVAISSKVRGVDGKWRALDARALYRITVAASECYNTAFETALTMRLGVRFEARADTRNRGEPVREVSGVSFGVIRHFSARRISIEVRYADLVRAYRREHGRDPARAVCHQLARQANLDTRQGKKQPRSLDQMRAAWRTSLTAAFGTRAVRQLMSAVPDWADLVTGRGVPGREEVEESARTVVAGVAAKRSTWTMWNLRAEAERLARERYSFGSLSEHRETVNTIVAAAVSPRYSVSVEAPALVDEPPALRREDGQSVFTEHAAARYTSQSVLDAEQRLVNAARTPVACGLPGTAAAAAIDGYEGITGRALDPGQRQLVTVFAARGTLVSVGLGPAGSGKTTAMRALAFVLRQGGQHLIPLATSAAAAEVLGRELGVHADNLHKFLYEHTRGSHSARLRSSGPVPATVRPYVLRQGDVILVDEAGMAGTFALDQLVSIATQHGSVVRLLGDDRQLSAVESGGALRLIAHDAGAAELTTLYRFKDPAEGTATLKLRTGDASGLDHYFDRGRVRSGSREAMAEAAYSGWRADMLSGKTTLMTAASSTDVTALSAQARTERVDAGQVEPDGVPLRDGTTAGHGDWIVTRENNRRLGVLGGRDWVKNGDAWRVVKRYRNGALRVEHLGHRGCVTLPAEYVSEKVQLLYATTAHRAQGTTVDTAHALITPEMSREGFYVTASRARERTIFYTATHDLLPVDEDQRLDAARTDPRSYAAREVLENVLAREGAELSATETIRVAQDQAESLATLVPRYMHAAQLLADGRYRRAAVEGLGAESAERLLADPAWGAVVRALYEAEMSGWQVSRLLAAVVNERELGTARSSAEVIAWRVDAYITDRPPPPRLDQPTEADAGRYADMLRELPGYGDAELDPAAAVRQPAPSISDQDEKRELAAELATNTAIEKVVRRAAGPQLGRRARAEPAWPALVAALQRAQRRGHDPGALLQQVARSRELRTARSVSEVLAWRIGKYLATGRSLDRDGGNVGARTLSPQAWAMLAWTMKAAENDGCDLREAIASVPAGADVADELCSLTQAATQKSAASCLPPWINGSASVPAGSAGEGAEMTRYLCALADTIKERVHALAADAARERTVWVQALGSVADGHTQYQAWLRHVEVVAAYRDQYQVTSDDPRQVLGTYAETGHAGHRAYWQATKSVFAARTIAGLEVPTVVSDEVGAQLAADLYMGLPEAGRASVRAEMAEQLSVLWLGGCGDDHAAIRPVYANALITALAGTGYLTQRAIQRAFSAGARDTTIVRGRPTAADRAGQQVRRSAKHPDLRTADARRMRSGKAVRHSQDAVPLPLPLDRQQQLKQPLPPAPR